MRLCIRALLAVVILGGVGRAASGAFVIDDRSFFKNLEHTFLDFESDGDGNELPLGFEVAQQRQDEYASRGFVYDERQVGWVETPVPGGDLGLPPEGNLGDAHQAMGSRRVAIGGTAAGWSINFTEPVRAFGLGIVQGRFPFGEPDPVLTSTIRAFNADGDEIGVVRFWDGLIDGQFGFVWTEFEGEEWRELSYGFMGLATSEPIARIEFTDTTWRSIFDDLHFSAVPAPGAGAAFGLLGLGALARRRR